VGAENYEMRMNTQHKKYPRGQSMRMNSQYEGNNTSGDEDVVTEGMKKKNKASSSSSPFQAFVLRGLPKIPLPRRYSAPKGGTTAINIRLQPTQRDQSENNSEAAKTSSCAEFHPRERNRRAKKFQLIFGDDEIEEEHPAVHMRPTKKKIFPQSALRGYNAVKAARLVRPYSWMENTPLILI